ncbi:hypothetical protein [Flavobacterium hungaricum]|uniref:Uncharacterized protein n=1 Tax=Flavobacterium hungaricum TaxID=2082725 RepID=A0ABR9TN34_9FLAO|nr:hypothetical protein [Flavobacterium hungaricum]MBE8726766.1 hypothetical protein [Flavobacterium hungaricum]
MKKYIIFWLCSFAIAFGQNKKVNIKKFAFNQCIIINYSKIDTNFYNNLNDASTVQFSVDGNFLEDPDLIEKVINFTTLQTSSYYSRKNNLHFEQGNKNIVFCDCFNFYESKQLDKFVRKLLSNTAQKP